MWQWQRHWWWVVGVVLGAGTGCGYWVLVPGCGWWVLWVLVLVVGTGCWYLVGGIWYWVLVLGAAEWGRMKPGGGCRVLLAAEWWVAGAISSCQPWTLPSDTVLCAPLLPPLPALCLPAAGTSTMRRCR